MSCTVCQSNPRRWRDGVMCSVTGGSDTTWSDHSASRSARRTDYCSRLRDEDDDDDDDNGVEEVIDIQSLMEV